MRRGELIFIFHQYRESGNHSVWVDREFIGSAYRRCFLCAQYMQTIDGKLRRFGTRDEGLRITSERVGRLIWEFGDTVQRKCSRTRKA